MSITVEPVVPTIFTSQGESPDLSLQPGTVIDAKVLQVLSDSMVRIAIGNLAIDVLTEVPLSAGLELQLTVSQTPDGIKLALVGPGPAAAAAASAEAAELETYAPVEKAAASVIDTLLLGDQLTPAERAAVSVAAETAATRQQSLAPLFANLAAVAESDTLPPLLRQAVMQLLAQRTDLDQNLSGEDIKNAFQKSGIFLESSLASGSIPQGGVPDLKAALIVLRQALISTLAGAEDTAVPGASPSPVGTAAPPPAPGTTASRSATGATATQAAGGTAAPQPGAGPVGSQSMASGTALFSTGAAAYAQEAAETQSLTRSFPPGAAMREFLVPQAAPLAADGKTVGAGRIVLSEALANTAQQAAAAGAVLSMLQQKTTRVGGDLRTPVSSPKDGSDQQQPNTPPPLRGGLPTGQRIADSSIDPHAPLSTTARHLLDETDAALARQTLMQVASLPDRPDASSRIDHGPRWTFEIPFALPQGTAIAQFEISRDGGGNEVEEATPRTWRARFSIDVEPAGPVHAHISLVGERTSVRMWAERPATAVQLRQGASELGQALSQAELQLGDIVVGDGAPPKPPPAPAGHFMDREL